MPDRRRLIQSLIAIPATAAIPRLADARPSVDAMLAALQTVLDREAGADWLSEGDGPPAGRSRRLEEAGRLIRPASYDDLVMVVWYLFASEVHEGLKPTSREGVEPILSSDEWRWLYTPRDLVTEYLWRRGGGMPRIQRSLMFRKRGLTPCQRLMLFAEQRETLFRFGGVSVADSSHFWGAVMSVDPESVWHELRCLYACEPTVRYEREHVEAVLADEEEFNEFFRSLVSLYHLEMNGWYCQQLAGEACAHLLGLASVAPIDPGDHA